MTEDRHIDCPLPSRLELHAHAAPSRAARTHHGGLTPVDTTEVPSSEHGRVAPARPTAVRRAMKMAAAAVLTVTTIVVPVAGLLNADSSVQLPVKHLSGATGGSTWVDTADPQITHASLDATVGAASRTRVRSPLLATACVPDGAADGTRQIVRHEQTFWPLAPGTYEIVSGYAWRISPISGQLLLHEGVDMAGPAGTPIYSVASGVVTEVAENSRSGAYIVVEHTAVDGTRYSSAYLHQYMNDILVKVGDKINAGQRIGAVGNNGWSTGPHLHFEIRDASGTAIDPIPFMEKVGAVYIGQECS